MKKERNSSIELLRILLMLLTVIMHTFGSGKNELNTCIGIIICVVGNIGVSCFAFISGYYGINLSVKKLFKLEFMIIFASYSMLVVRFLVDSSDMGLEELLRNLLPTIASKSWFITAYFALCLLTPFLNYFVEKVDKKIFTQLMITLLVLFSIIPTIFFFDMMGNGGKTLVHLIVMYLLGRYIYKYCDISKLSIGKCGIILGGVLLSEFCA